MAVTFKKPGQLPYASPNVLVPGAVSSIAKTLASNFVIPDSEQEEVISQSYLGTPVIDNLEFTGGSYTNLRGETIEYPTVTVDTVVFEVTRAKRIIETQIQGRDNSIFEYIGNSNYEISCTGVISNRANVIPSDLARDLQKVFDVPQQIGIVSLFLNEIFEIFNVVIRSHNITQTPGKRNEIAFNFVASQDVALEVNELEIE